MAEKSNQAVWPFKRRTARVNLMSEGGSLVCDDCPHAKPPNPNAYGWCPEACAQDIKKTPEKTALLQLCPHLSDVDTNRQADGSVQVACSCPYVLNARIDHAALDVLWRASDGCE